MGVLDKVRDALKTKHPELRYTESSAAIVVYSAPGGFNVSIGSDLIVAYDGWHEHFSTENEALECFAFGFSDKCRLKVTLCGAFPYKWTLETLDGELWIEESTTGLLFFPFWRARRVEYRQNGLTSRR